MATSLARKILFILGVAAFGAVGCGASGPREVAVTGQVLLDGQALETGRVIFESVDPNIPSEAGLIKNGAYRFMTQLGGKRVRIHSIRDVPGSQGKGMMGEPLREELVPADYNVKSTLEVEVTSDGPHRFDFDLRTKAP